MAGFLKKSQQSRWNNAASIVEGGGAGWRRVPGVYRQPQSAGVNIIVARVQANVDSINATFSATVAALVLGTGPAVDDEITVRNLNAGLINEAAVGNITGAYRAGGTTAEEVFVLLKGMTIFCFQGADSNWYAFQAGGAFLDEDAVDPPSSFGLFGGLGS